MPYQRDPDAGPYDAASDPYVDPNGVLKNNLSIKNTPDLNKAEANLTYLRTQELETTPLPGNFDLDHLKKIHKHLFGDVYPWAGEIRQVDIGKGNDLFAHHSHIEKEGGKLFKQLANEATAEELEKLRRAAMGKPASSAALAHPRARAPARDCRRAGERRRYPGRGFEPVGDGGRNARTRRDDQPEALPALVFEFVL